MKTINLCLIAVFFAIAVPSFAHAQSTNTDPYAAFYPVLNGASTTANYNFTTLQTPYLYIDLPSSVHNPGAYVTVSTGVNSSNLASFYYTGYIPQGASQLWIPLSQINTQGIWDITGSTIIPGSTPTTPSFGGVTQLAYGSNFHINSAPEPVGTILFLLGAVIMAVVLVRRRKALAV